MFNHKKKKVSGPYTIIYLFRLMPRKFVLIHHLVCKVSPSLEQ